jgi:hypothetical protein
VRSEKCKPMELSGDFCDRARPFGRARVKRNKTHALADEFLRCACRRNAVSRRDECGGESEVESESRDVVRGGHTAMAGDRTCHMTSHARERERVGREGNQKHRGGSTHTNRPFPRLGIRTRPQQCSALMAMATTKPFGPANADALLCKTREICLLLNTTCSCSKKKHDLRSVCVACMVLTVGAKRLWASLVSSCFGPDQARFLPCRPITQAKFSRITILLLLASSFSAYSYY